MFRSLDALETCVAETNFAARNKKCFCLKSKTFSIPDTNFASETRNNVSATMFFSLTWPLNCSLLVHCSKLGLIIE